MLRRLILPFSFVAFVAANAQQTPVYSRVLIGLDDHGHSMRALGALGLPIDHGERADGGYIVELSGHDIDLARASGFNVDVLIPDVKDFYRDQNAAGAPADDRALGWLCDGPTTFAVPEHFATGSYGGGYFTWDEMLAELDEMVALYPELISAKEAIGYSLENRPIHFVRISNAPNTDQDKPEVLYNAVHHAREPASMSQLIFYMWYLLDNYGTDAEATYLVDNRELYFVPCLNPDGYVYNQNTDPGGGGMWRKNRRDNGDGTFGVDLNRNYGWLWGNDDQGSSPDGNSETFRGAGPFSEPETQAVRDFCNAHEFRGALSYHAFGDMVIHPWGTEENLLTPDSALLAAHAARMTRNNGYSNGTCHQVLNYLVNGSSDDWMYGEQGEKPKILAMTPETGQADEGFWPPGWRIVPICEENMDQNLLQAHLVGAYASATDRSAPVFGQLSVYAPFDVQRLGLDPATFTVTMEPLENVVSVGAPVVFSDLEALEIRRDSILLGLNPSITDGDRVRFILAVGNGLYTHRDTVERYYGASATAYAEHGNDLGAWQAGSWGLTTEQWHSPPSSITDSPIGDYIPYAENILELADPIDLGDATSATLRFWAKWNVNRIRDLVQVSASSNGSSWTPLCGIWTRPGSYFQGNDEPVIEGRQLDWVQEEMSLDEFIGGDVLLRFRIASNLDYSRDGFYFDDLEVITTNDAISGIGERNSASGRLWNQPNPAADRTIVRYNGPALSAGARLTVHDALGATVTDVPFISRSRELDVQGLAPGLYSYAIQSVQGRTASARLLVVRP